MNFELNISRIKAIVIKEWHDVLKNRFMLFSILLSALIFPLVTLVPLGAIRFTARHIDSARKSELPPEWQKNPAYAGLSAPEVLQAHLGIQFAILFLVIPAAMPSMIASYSIVGEKREKTLEPLLATPITVSELLAGKTLASSLPGVAMAWLALVTYAFFAWFLAISPKVYIHLINGRLVLTILLLSPLMAALSAIATIMVSTRSTDPRAAQGIAALFVLPLVALLPAQILGVLTLNAATIVAGALGLALLDVILLYFATKLFQREVILTRWK